MKKKLSLLMATVLLLTMTTGCRKNKNTPTEATALPATEATDATTQETTTPTVDVLKEAPSAFEDVPEETTETTVDTLKPTETMRPSTGEHSQDISMVTPED